MKKLLMGCLAGLAAVMSFVGCDEKRTLYDGPSYVMFSDTLYQYGVQESNEIFNVPVAATRSEDFDRTFAVEVIAKQSNAIEGKHYRLLSNTVTIKAGEMTANVAVQGMYENIEPADSLGFVMRLIAPDSELWELYGNETKVMLQKVCPFDIHHFTGYCLVTSTFLSSDYMQNVSKRLIKSEIVEDEENTIVLHGLYVDGYDTKIKFDRKDVLIPLVEMEQHVCATTGEVFGTIYGDGNLLLSQSANYNSFYNSCENYVFQYVTLSVNNADGSTYGVVGTYINVIEWISDAEVEKLKEQGY